MRIVSLLPSATEIVLAVTGRVDHPAATLVGRSHECDFPTDAGRLGRLPTLTAARVHAPAAAWVDPGEIDRRVRELSAERRSLYTLDEQLLAELRPDLIVTQDLCEVCSIDLAAVRRAAQAITPPPRVLSLDPWTIDAVLDDVLRVADAIGLEREGSRVVAGLRERFFRAEEHVTPFAPGPPVAFLEWTDPLFVAGHWTPQLIERAGGTHPLNPTTPRPHTGAAAGPVGASQAAAGKSVRIPAEVLSAARPEALIVAPCGLDLQQAWRATEQLSRQPWWNQLPAVRRARVAVVDGNQMFNRPGPRLVNAYEFLVGWLNGRPELIPPGFPWRGWSC